MPSKLTAEEKMKILNLYKEGSSAAEIAKIIGRSSSTVSKVIKNSSSDQALEKETKDSKPIVESSVEPEEKKQQSEGNDLFLSVFNKTGMNEQSLLDLARKMDMLSIEELKALPDVLERFSKHEVPELQHEPLKEENLVEKTEEEPKKDEPVRITNEEIDYEYNLKFQQIKLSEEIMDAIGSSNANEAARIVRALSAHGFDFRRFLRLMEILENFKENNVSLKEFLETHEVISKLKEWGFDLPVLNHLANMLGIEKKELRQLIDQYLEFNKEKARSEKYLNEREKELDDLRKMRESLITQISGLKGKRNTMSDEVSDLRSTINSLSRQKEVHSGQYREPINFKQKDEYEIKEEIPDNREYISEILKELDKYAGMTDEDIANKNEISEIIPVKNENESLRYDYLENKRMVDIGFSIFEMILHGRKSL